MSQCRQLPGCRITIANQLKTPTILYVEESYLEWPVICNVMCLGYVVCADSGRVQLECFIL